MNKSREAWFSDRQLLVMMLGVPGSGKSTFARRLAARLDFERVSSDAIRTELFGKPAPHPPRTSPQGDPNITVTYTVPTFRVLNQRAESALLAGRSVIRDHMHHRNYWREGIGAYQANLVNALPVMCWIKTPHDVAHHRAMSRHESADTRTETDAEQMTATIQFYEDCIDPPADDEICLMIDGLAPFDEQLDVFIEFCREMLLAPE